MSLSPARRLHIAFALLMAPALISCTATVSPGGTTPGGGGRGPGAGTGGSPMTSGSGGGTGNVGGPGTGGGVVVPGSGGADVPPIGGAGGEIAESAGPMVLRRLTYRELNHTLRDLLGDTTDVTESWPPDTESTTKFEAPTDFSESIVTRVEEAAISVVDRAVTDNRLTPLIPCTNPAAGAAETTCARDFITRFGRKAYRRPLVAAEVTDLMAIFSYARGTVIGFDFRTSIGAVVKAMLQSPNFLYHWELGPTKPVRQGAVVSLTPHQVASRLSYLLWESMPDDALLDAADAGQLTTPEQVAAQATRLMMANKARAADALFSFHKQWLTYPNLGQTGNKDTMTYPGFTEAYVATLPQEISAFVSSVILDGDGTLKTLFTAPYAFVNQSTAPVYGLTATGTMLRRVELNPAQRSGILTQAAFLTTSGSPNGSDPIRRGLIVLERALCGHIDSPPPNLPIPDVPAKGGNIVTTRQQYAAHGSNPCAFCHKDLDPLGFAFENYDGLGNYRTMEGGAPIDSTGAVLTPGKQRLMFSSAVELSNYLATSEEVKTCMARQWFRYFSGRLEVPADVGSIQAVIKQASANPNYSIRDLLVGITKSMSFRYRVPSAGEPAI